VICVHKSYTSLLIALTFFTCAHSTEVEVLKVFCDHEPDNNLHRFFLNINQEDYVSSIIRRCKIGQYIYPIQELQIREIAISKHRDKEAILLSCPNYDHDQGGPFVISYLHNGLTDSYREITLWLGNQNGEWQVSTPPPEQKKVTVLKVNLRKFAGFTVGIRNIQIVE
jgi:hypothetical protein